MRKAVPILLTLGLLGASSGFLDAQHKSQDTRLDSLDTYVREQMARRHIPGLSFAVIKDGRIVAARGYGVIDETNRAPVTTSTLFQAGSISKPVSALGALHLVEAGRLSLDSNVNGVLTSWHVPENDFTAREKVTLRRILSHSAGLTVHGFPGYDLAQQIPTLVQILDGTPPANTAAIRADTTPGSIWRYSGGGFTIMQQMINDVTGMPFPRFMEQTVLGPIGMMNSSFEQPQPPQRAALTASGFYADRTPVHGRWHVYPEMAAAGLWTTPTDLARFAIEIREAFAGRGHGVISPSMARQYLTGQMGGSGLGIVVQGSGKTLSFSHGGRDEGFDAFLFSYAESGDGAVIMINANDNSHFMGRIRNFIGRTWGWPDAGPAPVAVHNKQVGATILARYAGYYEFHENEMIVLAPNTEATGLETLADGLPDETFLALDSLRFRSSEDGIRVGFNVDSLGMTTGVLWQPGERANERTVSRVAPLLSTQQPSADPDQGLTNRITAALQAIRRGGTTLLSEPNITSGAKRDFADWNGMDFDGIGALTYLGTGDVSGRSIHRHGTQVARVRYYRMTTSAGTRYLLVHLAENGSVTDFDVMQK